MDKSVNKSLPDKIANNRTITKSYDPVWLGFYLRLSSAKNVVKHVIFTGFVVLTIRERCGCISLFASVYAMHTLLILNGVGKIDPYWL